MQVINLTLAFPEIRFNEIDFPPDTDPDESHQGNESLAQAIADCCLFRRPLSLPIKSTRSPRLCLGGVIDFLITQTAEFLSRRRARS